MVSLPRARTETRQVAIGHQPNADLFERPRLAVSEGTLLSQRHLERENTRPALSGVYQLPI